jgi:hypothetical protein
MTTGGFGEPTGPQDQPQFGQGPFSPSPGDPAQAGQQPQSGQAQSGQPQYGQPQYGAAPNYGQPQYGGAPTYGQPQYGGMPYARTGRGTNSLAIAALCCGIGQVLAGPLAGIPAVILGFMALGQIRQTGEDGRGMAITGLVLGIVGLALTVLVILLVVAFAHSVSSTSMVPAG